MERQAVTKVQKMPFGNNHPRQQFAPSSSARNPLLELQRSVGNQAIQRLTSSPFIQAKLKISTPGDPFEQEADRIADTVMRMPEPTVSRQAVVQPALSHITPLAQRETDRPDEENEIVSPKSKSRIPVAVRDDDDEEEKPLVQRACAEFGTGQYAPESRDGRQLLAHKLTHVVQQNGNHMQSAQPLSIQRWEWFDQMRRVGPYDMILAGLAANEAKFEAEHSLLPGFSDGPQDAFRHTYWSCLLALDIGADQAKEVGDIHEDQAPDVSPMITLMDQHNNAIGRALAQQVKSRSDVRGLVWGALRRGNLLIIENWRARSDARKAGQKPPAAGRPVMSNIDPDDLDTSIKPLPKSTLDVVKLNTEYRIEREKEMVALLKKPIRAGDVKANVARNKELIEVTKRAASLYWSGYYRDRFESNRADDELVTLLRRKLSPRFARQIKDMLTYADAGKKEQSKK